MAAAVAFYFAVYLQGLAWALLAGARLGATSCVVLAYPLGLLLWVALSALFAFSPLPYRPFPLLLGWALLLVVAVALQWSGRRRLDRRARVVAAAGSAGFAILAVLLHAADLTVSSFDSHMILILGRSMAFHGGPLPDLGGWLQGLGSRGLFQVFVHGTSLFLGVPYLQAAAPLLAASFVAAFVHLGARALAGPGSRSPAALGLAGLTALVMSSTYFMLSQALYIHDNYAAGLYLCLFAASFWLADSEREAAWLPFAFAFLLAFSIMRTETVLPALLFLAIAHTQTSLSGRAISPWLIGYALALEIWFALLSPHLHGAAGVLTPARRAVLMSAVALAWPALTLLRRPAFAWLRAHLPTLLLGAAVLAVLVALRLDPDKMSRSGAALLTHMREPSWGGIWYALVLLWLLALRLPRLPLHPLFRTGPATYLLLIYFLAFVRVNPYRGGWGDSGNRMLTHVVAIGFFGLLLFYGRRADCNDARGCVS